MIATRCMLHLAGILDVIASAAQQIIVARAGLALRPQDIITLVGLSDGVLLANEQGAYPQDWKYAVSRLGQCSSRWRTSVQLFMSRAVRQGRASATVRTPDSPSLRLSRPVIT